MDKEVKTADGIVAGCEENGLMLWRGIPYAAPPVGELRFKRAQKHPGWDGVLDCTKFRSKCWQFGGGKFQKIMDSPTMASEDCLFLNIWSSKENEKKPVFVWIHGGGQYGGEASSPDYDLSSFAENGIVGVSFNYRLGVLGFYDFSEYGEKFESNCAISDMLKALEWIHNNISLFGGDPDNVTLCGESAGGTCVMALLASFEARKYFNRAIIMSGVLNNLLGKNIKDYNNEIFFKKSGISKARIDDLMTADYDTLLKGCACRFDGSVRDFPGMLTSGPVIDDLIPESPIETLRSGKLADKEIMIGSCKDEGGLFEYLKLGFSSWDEAMSILRRNGYEDRVDSFTAVYKPGESGSSDEKNALLRFNTDIKFWAGLTRLALEAVRAKAVYVYRFDYTTPVSRLLKMGATHTMDITAAFNIKGSTLYKFAVNDNGVKDLLHSRFINFIRTGNPNENGSREWFLFEEKNKATMLIDTKLSMVSAPRDEFYELWKDMEID